MVSWTIEDGSLTGMVMERRQVVVVVMQGRLLLQLRQQQRDGDGGAFLCVGLFMFVFNWRIARSA